MEELQSTEILDREILEDARKKAFRILKASDEDIKARSLEWEKKAANDLDELRRKFSEEGKITATEITARLPMDKRRIKAQVLEGLLARAVESWYAGLDRTRVLELIKKELQILLGECDEFSVGANSERSGQVNSGRRVSFHGLTESEARGIVKALSPAVLPAQDFSYSETVSGGAFPELLIENKAVRICGSINKAVDFFLREKRAELVSALLGEQNDGEGLC